MSAVAQALLEHGYEVTTVFYAKSNIVHEKYNEILIEDRWVQILQLPQSYIQNCYILSDFHLCIHCFFLIRMVEVYKNFSKIYMESGGSLANAKIWIEGMKLMNEFRDYCKATLIENPRFVKMLDEKTHIDAVISMGTCGYYLAHHFNCPLIPISTAGPFSLLLKPGLGNSINPMVRLIW